MESVGKTNDFFYLRIYVYIYFAGYQGYGGHLQATNETQTFTNPYGPWGYQDNMHVTWWINTHNPNFGIQIKFLFLDIEPPCYDFLDFYAEGTSGCKQLLCI